MRLAKFPPCHFAAVSKSRKQENGFPFFPAICSSITDEGGSPLTIESTGQLEITGQSGMNSTWNANLTINGLLQFDNAGNIPPPNAPYFQWTGGSISGAQSGTNPWGIYVCGGDTWSCQQNALNLGVTMNIALDALHQQNQTAESTLSISGTGNNQLTGNLILKNNANINIDYDGGMALLNETNSAKVGGIAVDDQNSTSTVTVYSGGTVVHGGDQNGQTLLMQPLVVLNGGTWSETSQWGPSSINFSCQAAAAQNDDGAVQLSHGGALKLSNKASVTAGNGITVNNGGTVQVNALAGGTAQVTITGNVYDNLGGNLQIGYNGNGWAALTVNGNVDIEDGGLTMWVQFDQNGNLSNYDRLSVFGQFAVSAQQSEWSTSLNITTLLTNNVQPIKGQVINLVTATTTKTALPPNAFRVFNYTGYTYASDVMTATGYQLTT